LIISIIEEPISDLECTSNRRCTFSRPPNAQPQETPECFVTKNVGYKVSGQRKQAESVIASLKMTPSPNPNRENNICPPSEDLNLVISYVTERIVRIKINKQQPGRYEVPLQNEFNIPTFIDSDDKKRLYNILINETDSSIIIQRTDNNAKLIDTSIGGLTFCENFVQFATYLPKDADFYGFGENYRNSFRHDTGYKTQPIFPRFRGYGEPDSNGLGQHPFMMGVQDDKAGGKAFGLFMLTSNAMGRFAL